MKNNDQTIVYVSPYYPPHLGGLENVARAVAEEIARKGYETEVITTTSSGIRRGVTKEGKLRITTLGSFEFAHTPISPLGLFRLFSIPKNSIIHVHLSQAFWPELVYFVSKIRRIPYVVHFHLDVKPSSKIFGAFFLVYKKLVWGPFLRGAKRVIVFSYEQSLLVQSKYGVKKECVAVIPNGVGEEFFMRDVRPLPKDCLQLLYVGRLSVQKRVERLIDMLSITDLTIHLTIVGEGEEKEKLEAHMQSLGLTNVSFEGKKTGEDLMSYYRKSDALVISSDIEGMSLVVLEAMAAGLPIIASDVLGLRELVENVGVLVSEPYPENFARALREIREDGEQLHALSRKSLEKAEQYSWKKLVSLLEKVYDEVYAMNRKIQ